MLTHAPFFMTPGQQYALVSLSICGAVWRHVQNTTPHFRWQPGFCGVHFHYTAGQLRPVPSHASTPLPPFYFYALAATLPRPPCQRGYCSPGTGFLTSGLSDWTLVHACKEARQRSTPSAWIVCTADDRALPFARMPAGRTMSSRCDCRSRVCPDTARQR